MCMWFGFVLHCLHDFSWGFWSCNMKIKNLYLEEMEYFPQSVLSSLEENDQLAVSRLHPSSKDYLMYSPRVCRFLWPAVLGNKLGLYLREIKYTYSWFFWNNFEAYGKILEIFPEINLHMESVVQKRKKKKDSTSTTFLHLIQH